MKNTITLLALILSFNASSQEVLCGFDIVNDTIGQAKMNRLIESAQLFKSKQIYTIPLVVHVMHKGEAIGDTTNISDEQIHSAVVALNEDYRKISGTNGDGEGVDSEIEFCLASVDPDGNATNGINRIDATVVEGYEEAGIAAGGTIGDEASEVAIKDLSRWDRDFYYNIWLVSEIRNNNGGSGIQGFSYFPGGSVARDGAVILYNAFGTVGTLKSYTNMNRVTTHELGHAFFLYHVFQGNSCDEEDNCELQGDRVCDTYPTVQITSCSSTACDDLNNKRNYEGYTSQTCQDEFTQGQKDRMRAAIETYRPEMLTSPGCGVAPECVGDINLDGVIGILDFIQLNSAYGDECDGCPEDLNGDDQVTIEDFLILNSAYGDDCGEGVKESIDFSRFNIHGQRVK